MNTEIEKNESSMMENISNVPVEQETSDNKNPISSEKKNRRRPRFSLWTVLFCALLAAVISFQITFVSVSLGYEKKMDDTLQILRGLDKFTNVADLFQKQSIYNKNLSSLDESLTQALVYGYGDRFSFYYTAEEWEASRKESTGNMSGFGISVTLAETGGVYIYRVFANSPADKAGIQSGDIIVKVDGVSLIGRTLNDAVSVISGEIGSEADVLVHRGDTELSFTVTRDHYEAEVVASRMIEANGKKVGYLRWTEFQKITSVQFKKAVNALIEAGADGLVFDVRDNSGGDLDVALQMIDFLVPAGNIVTIRTHEGETQTFTSTESEIDIPMVVITNGNTVSAAELFTIALRDYDKAKSVGEKTFGKGCGQTGTILSDGSVVFVTNFYYDPPKSENFNGVGIIPHVIVEMPEAYRQTLIELIPEEDDAQLQMALQVLFEF